MHLKDASKTVGLNNRAIYMEDAEAQNMARNIRNHERYNNDAAVGELYAQMLRDGGDAAVVLEGSAVDNSQSGEYNDVEKTARTLDTVDAQETGEAGNLGGVDSPKRGNYEVRKWYIEQVSNIPKNINPYLSAEEQARNAFEARNNLRTKARAMMADEATRQMLETPHPNKSFEELVESKMRRKGMTREDAMKDVLFTATSTNKSVNAELGLGGE